MNPSVSICIPAFSQPLLIVRAVRSVFAQFFSDFEIIVTDDSKSDEVWNALEPWHKDSRLVYVHNPSRLGSPGNWNKAMSLARSDLIKFLHHDDWFTDPSALGKYVDLMNSREEISFAFSSANACNDDGTVRYVHKVKKDQLNTLRSDPRSLQFGNFIGAPSATIFRKQVGFLFDENLQWVVDIDGYIDLLGEKPNFHYLQDSLVNISSNSAHQVTRTLSTDKVSRIAEHMYLYSKRPPKKNWVSIKAWRFLFGLFYECNAKDLQDIQNIRKKNGRTLQESVALNLYKLHSIFMNKLFEIKKTIKKVFSRKVAAGKQSYSQCGEDMIIDFLLMWLGIKRITYLDIGAHHPTWLSNTYHFYKLGHSGLLIEPDDHLCQDLRSVRPRDTIQNIAIGTSGNDMMNMYVMTSKSLNTLDEEQAKALQLVGREKIEAVIKVQRLGINELLNKYFKEEAPVFVSLDVEGLDYSILKAWDFSHFRPAVFCVETLTYTQNNSERKLNEIIELMNSKGYRTYSDTFVNTIFVCENAWKKRPIYG